MLVFVINKNNQPLMPCTARKAKILLKQHRAKIIKRTPFTIKLFNGSSGYKQEITLGIDTGSKEVGFSATTPTKVLFENKLILRTDIVKLLATRREFRKTRRARKTRYRQPRFLNRKKADGWLAPSIENKISAHLKSTALIYNILPIAKTIVEVANFDIQKINNPNIQGKEYQQGNQLNFWNVREYVLFRDKHKCKGKRGCTNKILNVHHIETRKTGGNSPDNLITLCKDCHSDYHRGKLKLSLKRNATFRDATFMGIMRWAFYNKLKSLYPNVSLTFGYLTKNTRITNKLSKEHVIDARCISGNPLAVPSLNNYLSKRVRTQNRQLHKATINKGGTRKRNKSPKYVNGFQLFDKVLYQNQECFIFGRRATGSFDVRTLAGLKLSAGTPSKRLKLLEKANSTLIERKKTHFVSVLLKPESSVCNYF